MSSDPTTPPLDVEAIKKLSDEASPGPWTIFDHGSSVWNADGFVAEADGEADLAFIAAAREAVPALLAALSDVERRVEVAERERDEARHLVESLKTMARTSARLSASMRQDRDAAQADRNHWRDEYRRLTDDFAALRSSVERMTRERESTLAQFDRLGSELTKARQERAHWRHLAYQQAPVVEKAMAWRVWLADELDNDQAETDLAAAVDTYEANTGGTE